MRRSSLCLCIAVLSFYVAGPSRVDAQSDAKQNPARSVEVKKVFGYYNIYLRLPPQERDGFRMSYRLSPRDGGVMPQMTYVLGNSRTPVQTNANGKVLNMPDANMFQNGKIEIAAGQPGGSVSMNLEAIVPLSRAISIADASNPLVDYAAAVRRAGPLAVFAPKLSAISFKGGTGGHVVFSDGRRTPLPVVLGAARFQPDLLAMRGAVTLAFSSAPIEVEFAR